MATRGHEVKGHEVLSAYDSLINGGLESLGDWMTAGTTYEGSLGTVKGKLQVLRCLTFQDTPLSLPPQVRGMTESELRYGAQYGFVVMLIASSQTIVHDLYFGNKRQLIAIKSTV